MNSLFSILKKHIEETPVLKSAKAVLSIDQANKIISELFGEQALDFMQAKYVKNGFIYIWCKSPIVANELRLNEVEILARIRQEFASATISGIKTIL